MNEFVLMCNFTWKASTASPREDGATSSSAVNRNLNSARHKVSKSAAASSVKETGSCTSSHLDKWMTFLLVIPLKIYTFVIPLLVLSPLPLFSIVFISVSCIVSHLYSLSSSNEFFLLALSVTFYYLSNCCFLRFLPLHLLLLSFSSSLCFCSHILWVIWGRDTASCLRPLKDF